MVLLICKRIAMAALLLSAFTVNAADLVSDEDNRAGAESLFTSCLQSDEYKGQVKYCAKYASDIIEPEITDSYNSVDYMLRKKKSSNLEAFEESQRRWEKNREDACKKSEEKEKCLMEQSIDRLVYLHGMENNFFK